jgi:DivIVA domain-containing protein
MEPRDDEFHLTPVDVRRYEFGSSMRGYDRARVDQFRDQVADELERLIRQNTDLDTKARGFHEQLKHFRDRDKALNEALVSAQQLREDVKEQAQREADLLIREAQAAASQITDDARSQIGSLMREIESLDRTRRAYLAQIRALAERHLAEVDAAMQQRGPSAERES